MSTITMSPPVGVVAESALGPTVYGLTDDEAEERRAHGQGNNVQFQTSRSYAQILRENVFTFTNDVLFGLGIVLVALGRPSDALVSVGVVLFNVIIGVFQEVRAKRTLDQIALLTRPRVNVIRAGHERAVDPSEIVMGDIVVARPGDQIVVDGQVIGNGHIDVDESLLTGEANLIHKTAGDPIYSGSFCVTGSALYETQKVGAESFANQLTASARTFRRVLTPLQREINLIIRVIVLIAAYFQVLLLIGSLLRNVPMVESVRMSVVIAGLVPNGLLLAVAVAYAMGAMRMSGKGALVQQANAVESLSHVDVLCLDKTGTLTANRLQLQAVHPMRISEPELRAILGDYAASVSAGNRTSEAIRAACGGQRRPVRQEVPFSSVRKWSALAFDDAVHPGVYVLGAPEILSPHLRSSGDLEPLLGEWTARGLRVVLFAYSPEPAPLLDVAGEPALPDSLVPLGALSLSDELRPQARETLDGFAKAGVQVKIISGDSPDTVAALAQQAGLAADIGRVSGPTLAEMTEADFARAAEETTIFGRITPEQKEKLVRALREQGHHVAMIGDGVNDVLALKQADLGIAMQSGSQAARAVADIVLLNDSFASLPEAVGEGQRILNGMQSILKLFLTRILYFTLLLGSIGVLGGFPFLPKQSSLVTVFTVGIPTVALAAWARPGKVQTRNLVRSLVHFILPAALTLTLAALLVYLAYFVPSARALSAMTPGMGEEEILRGALPIAQSALTTFAVLCGLLLVQFVELPTSVLVGAEKRNSDRRPVILSLALLAVYAVILIVPALGQFFDLAPLAATDYLLLAAGAVAWGLLVRWVWRTRVVERFLDVDFGVVPEEGKHVTHESIMSTS